MLDLKNGWCLEREEPESLLVCIGACAGARVHTSSCSKVGGGMLDLVDAAQVQGDTTGPFMDRSVRLTSDILLDVT